MCRELDRGGKSKQLSKNMINLADIDEITLEMLNYYEDAVVGWVFVICECSRRQEVPDEWMKGIIVLLHEGSRQKCNSYTGISLLSVPGEGNGNLD